MERNRILIGDCIESMRKLPAEFVHCVITSPPYFNLRSYLPNSSPLKTLELGTERTPEEYVANQVVVFREVRRILHPSGVLFVNYGDSFCSTDKWGGGGSNTGKQTVSWSGGAADCEHQLHVNKGSEFYGRDDFAYCLKCGAKASCPSWQSIRQRKQPIPGIKPKDLLEIPSMVAAALRADGWYLRQRIPWLKRSGMPESCSDRPTSMVEYFFMFTKSESYYFDMEAIKRPTADSTVGRLAQDVDSQAGSVRANGGAKTNGTMKAVGDGSRRFFRNTDLFFDSLTPPYGLITDAYGELLALDVVNSGTKEQHFASYTPKLVEPWVLAGTSEKGGCPQCKSPWKRVVEKDRKPTRSGDKSKVTKLAQAYPHRNDIDPAINWRHSTLSGQVGNRDAQRHVTTSRTLGWEPTCDCCIEETEPALVFDPFGGTGTTARVAKALGRDWLVCELNPASVEIIERLIATPLYSDAPKAITPMEGQLSLFEGATT